MESGLMEVVSPVEIGQGSNRIQYTTFYQDTLLFNHSIVPSFNQFKCSTLRMKSFKSFIN